MTITINGSGTITGITAGGLPDAIITQPELATGVAGTGPAFSARQSTTQSVASSTNTKILLQTEIFDTNNNFASSAFTPTVAGYYQLNWRVGCNTGAAEVFTDVLKNGTLVAYGIDILSTTYGTGGSGLFYANGTTDYFELYFFQSSGVPKDTTALAAETYFSGFLARSA